MFVVQLEQSLSFIKSFRFPLAYWREIRISSTQQTKTGKVIFEHEKQVVSKLRWNNDHLICFVLPCIELFFVLCLKCLFSWFVISRFLFYLDKTWSSWFVFFLPFHFLPSPTFLVSCWLSYLISSCDLFVNC